MLQFTLSVIISAACLLSEPDSIAIRTELLRNEALALTEKATKQGVISGKQKDSLILEINRLAAVEPDAGINSLESFIRQLDDEYDTYMRIADKSAEAIIERYEWLFHKPLTLPSDYIDPREAIMRNNEYTASVVLKSIMDNLNAERLWGWQRWLQRNGFYLFGNAGVYSGKLIPQMGGLYYIPVPGGAPSPENPYTSGRFKDWRMK